MEIALMGASMLDRSWDEFLDAASKERVRFVEACSGGHIPKVHYDPVELASNDASYERFAESLSSRGMAISSFSCHGNPLHPNEDIASRAHDDFVATCDVAAKMNVRHVSVLGGCPGGGPEDRVPNWIINSAFPTWAAPYEWQWSERVLPYWRRAAEVADANGVKICVEPHSADVVYNYKTFTRLREAIGPTIGMNFDPSHLWWQGVDPLVFIQAVGEAIYTCHIKDVHIDTRTVALDGILSPEKFHAWDKRPWTFSTPGYGHSQQYWSQFIRTLRHVGYNGYLSIECEDPFMTPDDTFENAVTVLRKAIPSRPKPRMDWAIATGAGAGSN